MDSPEVFDLWEYYQWKSPTATIEEYRDKPWAHCQDSHQAYLSARFNKRSEFLHHMNPEDKAKIQHELKRIEKVRINFPTDWKKQALMDNLKKTLRDWRSYVSNNKATLADDINEESQQEGYRPYRRQREHDTLQRYKTSEIPSMGAADQSGVISDPPKRWSSQSLHGKVRGPKASAQKRWTSPPTARKWDDDGGSEGPEPLYGLKASVMYFQRVDGENSAWRGWTNDHTSYGESKFPNQKVAMHKILEDTTDNPLMEPCPENCIRYFHFPTNNMQWIEKAVARYYNEEPEPLDDRHHTYSRKAKKTEKLLSREFWRGQMHGSSAYGSNPRTRLGNAQYPKEDWAKKGGPIHARHMRSKCAIIPKGNGTQQQHNPASKTSALGEGEKLADSSPSPHMASSKGKNVALFLPYMHWETSSRRAKMVQVINETIGHRPKDLGFPNVTMRMMETTNMGNMEEKPKPWRRLLARYLFTLAQVAEQMDYEADERLLQDYVNADPPLHIRRTLDQYYFVTLDDTSQRDKDQVVYRGTLDKEKNRVQSRVVMVDQLWLWILDDNTIITSFPRRWGRNKPDPSGVHKSLRERFEARPEDIKSAEHLALIIIDQCSRVFFDRTKPLDQRPEVMDIFASAIAHVDQMTAVAYDTFWRNTNLYNKNMLPQAIGTKYLDINPEGALLKEAQDIAEELKMMKRIYNEQLKVVKDFKRHLVRPQGRRAEKADGASQLQQLLHDLIDSRDKTDGNEEEYDGYGTSSWHKRSEDSNQDADETLHEAEGVLELVRSRRAEIIELEQSAIHTCQQLEGFLTLKQQQASIVEAKAALQRAEESVKQGRAIMAFTIVTIFFLPLGFFAAFFGMNNSDINDAKWMTLNDQIKYMFSLSTVVIILSTCIAFYPSMRPLLAPILKPGQIIYNTVRELHEVFSDPSGVTSKRRDAKRVLQEVQRRLESREAAGWKRRNLQKAQMKLGEPEDVAELTGRWSWLRQGRGKATNGGGNGVLPK